MIAKLRADRGSGAGVVYVPGIDGTGELLLGTAARLEEDFRLLRFHYLAEGEASPATDSYANLAASIAEGVRARGMERCVVVCESFGGAVGLQLALDHPQLVRGLIVVNSFAHYPSPNRLAWSMRLAPHLPRSLFNFGRRWLAPRSLFGHRREADAVARFRALPGAFFDAGYIRRLAMIAELDLRPRLREVAQPVALYASSSDRIVPSTTSMAALHAALPDSTLEVIEGAGHMVLPLSDEPWPERVREMVERAL